MGGKGREREGVFDMYSGIFLLRDGFLFWLGVTVFFLFSLLMRFFGFWKGGRCDSDRD